MAIPRVYGAELREEFALEAKTTVERAFELARSGNYVSVQEIRAQLGKERFPLVREHLEGASIRKQLADIVRNCRP